jgi:hypothetical protein
MEMVEFKEGDHVELARPIQGDSISAGKAIGDRAVVVRCKRRPDMSWRYLVQFDHTDAMQGLCWLEEAALRQLRSAAA